MLLQPARRGRRRRGRWRRRGRKGEGRWRKMRRRRSCGRYCHRRCCRDRGPGKHRRSSHCGHGSPSRRWRGSLRSGLQISQSRRGDHSGIFTRSRRSRRRRCALCRRIRRGSRLLRFCSQSAKQLGKSAAGGLCPCRSGSGRGCKRSFGRRVGRGAFVVQSLKQLRKSTLSLRDGLCCCGWGSTGPEIALRRNGLKCRRSRWGRRWWGPCRLRKHLRERAGLAYLRRLRRKCRIRFRSGSRESRKHLRK